MHSENLLDNTNDPPSHSLRLSNLSIVLSLRLVRVSYLLYFIFVSFVYFEYVLVIVFIDINFGTECNNIF